MRDGSIMSPLSMMRRSSDTGTRSTCMCSSTPASRRPGEGSGCAAWNGGWVGGGGTAWVWSGVVSVRTSQDKWGVAGVGWGGGARTTRRAALFQPFCPHRPSSCLPSSGPIPPPALFPLSPCQATDLWVHKEVGHEAVGAPLDLAQPLVLLGQQPHHLAAAQQRLHAARHSVRTHTQRSTGSSHREWQTEVYSRGRGKMLAISARNQSAQTPKNCQASRTP